MRFTNRITFTRPTPKTALVRRREAISVTPPDQPAMKERAVTSLRGQFPFLNDPGTPVELKALVTERITRYHEYSNLYQQLRNCSTVEECAATARRLLNAYLDNQAIYRELHYYQKYGKVLGKHPMFRHFQQLAYLRSSSVKDLLREQQKTKDNIWRVNSEIKKGNKPHLDGKRRQKLQEYELKLQEINRLLGE